MGRREHHVVRGGAEEVRGHVLDLPPQPFTLLLLALAVEIDPRFGRIVAYLNDHVSRTRPTLGLALALAAIMVSLILAAQYEKWSLPLSVLLALPFGTFGALTAVYFRNLNNDVYFQIGLVTLLGLAAGPLVTGILADRLGLENAMKIVPMVAVGALVALYLGRRAYPASLAKVRAAAVARRPVQDIERGDGKWQTARLIGPRRCGRGSGRSSSRTGSRS